MYTLPNKDLWSGRTDSEIDESQFRFHQVVECQDINALEEEENGLALIGFESEEGVRRNKGRLGAKEAPNQIRQALASTPYMLKNKSLVDVGNVVCEGKNLEGAQQALGENVTKILNKKQIPIILGGGHETFHGHYQGARKFIGADKKLGILNIDAHFDMRTESMPTSGTMFKQILDSDENASYFVLGIQEFGNTKQLFDAAESYENCQYMMAEEIVMENQSAIFRAIDAFAETHDYLIVTLCSDSIRSFEAPGVSAPSPFGLDAKVVRMILNYIVKKDKTLSFDISEINPSLDQSGQTVKLASQIVVNVMKHFKNVGGIL